MEMNVYIDEEIIVSGIGKFFYEEREFSNIIKIVRNFKRFDISKLKDLPEWFDDLLHDYQTYTKMSDNKIYQICVLLNRQINKLEELING